MQVLIADSRPKVRRALRVLLEQAGQVQVVGEAAEAAVLFSRLVHTEADLVLLDGDLPGMPMVELLAVLRRIFYEVGVIVLSARPEAGPAALAAGADAFVSKGDPAEQLLAAIDECRRLLQSDPDHHRHRGQRAAQTSPVRRQPTKTAADVAAGRGPQ